jgi:hypothetical protein
VASRNLRSTSKSHFKTAAVGRSCKVRRGARHTFLRAPDRVGGRQAKELLSRVAFSKPNYNTLPKHFARRACQLFTARWTFCMCGFPQPSKHLMVTLQDCGSGRKLQSTALGAPHFSLSPGPNGGKASEGVAGLDRMLPGRTTTHCQNVYRETHFDCPGPHGLSAFVASHNFRNTSKSHFKTAAVGGSCKVKRGRSTFFSEPRSERVEASEVAQTFPAKDFVHLWRPATFGALRTHTSRLRQWAEAAKCGVGYATLFSEPRAERGEIKRRSCWAGSHPPSRTTKPCQNISREEQVDCPRPHGPSALVVSCSLRNTSNSHFKTAAVGRSCKVRRGAPHFSPKRQGCRS